jgi:DNA-directed RNA polymerase specialized sigma subunit, sigma24 homolog
VCQEVWLIVWWRFGDFRGEARFIMWIHSIVVRCAIDHLRKCRCWYECFLFFDAIEHSVVAAIVEIVFETELPECVYRLRVALDVLLLR